ncbi:MAG TPA: VCBS repeat-containing protein, partial [Cyclobacteriaceae bacterium]|nr:VCBS repeat-containing protein [Cyclobacteriaceae bacterium]
DMLPPDEKTLKTYGSEERSDIYNYKIVGNGYQHQVSRNSLQRNNGNGTSFSEVALVSNVSATDWSWSPLFADFDNDGWKDLFITSGIVKRPVDLDYIKFVSDLAQKINRHGSTDYDEETLSKMPDGSIHPFLFHNEKEVFNDVSESSGLSGLKGFFNGAAYGDLNNDGNIDIVVNSLNAEALVLRNTSPKKNFLNIEFKGNGLNTKGIGAKAFVYFDKDKIQFQQLMPTRGFQSSTDYQLHFGLDVCQKIDSILIVWPNQKYQIIRDSDVNKLLSVNESMASGVFKIENFVPTIQENFVDISSQVQCDWRHSENQFEDFNNQHLIPHKESTRGPKLAVADVNNDGLDDFYVCGASGTPGALMIQTLDGNYVSSDTTLFNRFSICEDVDAHFFDANGDG